MRLLSTSRSGALSVLAASCALALVGLCGKAAAQSNQPTFQGSLASSGLPATGTYDIRFSLFAAGTGGTALQSGIVSGVAVSNGLFSATLPFDPNLYSATLPRWVGIEVRTTGSTTFTALTPRLAVSPAPVALSMPGVNREVSATLDQSIAEAATTPGQSLNSTRWQSFTCTASGQLRSCTVLVGNTSGASRTVTANLYAGEGISGAPIATTTFAIAANTPGASINFLFPAAPRVAAGNVLTLSLSSTISLVTWGLSPTDVYAGGRSSVSATQDFNLQTFVEVDGATPGYTFAGNISAASAELSGKLSATSAELGAYVGGTGTSVVADFNKQLVLAGPFNATFNGGDSVKLLISDYDNDAGADIYPIYVEDENNIVDFFLRKVGSATIGPASAYFGGNLGLGVLAPGAKLDLSSPSVAAGAWQILIRNDSTANRGGIRMTNDGFLDISNIAQNGTTAVSARLNSTGAWTSTSDGRMKNDITTMHTGQLLDAALKLRPVTFYFNAEKLNGQVPPQPHLGLIAQEVLQVVPDLVSQGDGLLTLNYAGLSVVALGAVQEQQKIVTELRGRADALQAEVKHLRSDNEALARELRQMRMRLDGLEQSVQRPH
jgi:hypothetical protein